MKKLKRDYVVHLDIAYVRAENRKEAMEKVERAILRINKVWEPFIHEAILHEESIYFVGEE